MRRGMLGLWSRWVYRCVCPLVCGRDGIAVDALSCWTSVNNWNGRREGGRIYHVITYGQFLEPSHRNVKSPIQKPKYVGIRWRESSRRVGEAALAPSSQRRVMINRRSSSSVFPLTSVSSSLFPYLRAIPRPQQITDLHRHLSHPTTCFDVFGLNYCTYDHPKSIALLFYLHWNCMLPVIVATQSPNNPHHGPGVG
ncbi:hypothetical protein JAAARDRAFT_580867 [Jaapia argillacea MUCL 33604]|uniref:Secreted protein n=1 Tax=Jaapia argillacea MUCL 33604 TaxID=933084 RepID=A0A067P757_9AGAM|nr:hypothetical protein JAAARDRAFT_580867 [Jaapia argillacea MUCL 33604]